mgnify:FL=1
MITEYKQVFDCPECKTDFNKGDIVQCSLDTASIYDSMFDCGGRKGDIGIVIGVTFYKDYQGGGMGVVVCELTVYWAIADMTTYHLDRYLEKMT